jgi:hypothetical protein
VVVVVMAVVVVAVHPATALHRRRLGTTKPRKPVTASSPRCSAFHRP